MPRRKSYGVASPTIGAHGKGFVPMPTPDELQSAQQVNVAKAGHEARQQCEELVNLAVRKHPAAKSAIEQALDAFANNMDSPGLMACVTAGCDWTQVRCCLSAPSHTNCHSTVLWKKLMPAFFLLF